MHIVKQKVVTCMLLDISIGKDCRFTEFMLKHHALNIDTDENAVMVIHILKGKKKHSYMYQKCSYMLS